VPDESARRRLPTAWRHLIRAVQILLYIPIQAVFVPFAIIGLLDGIRKEVGNSRRLDVSFTALQALQYRWIMHHFDTRPDPLSVDFTKKFPCESHFGLWATLGALIISRKLFGFSAWLGELDEPGEETLSSTPGRRLLLFDRILEKYVDEMGQIVIPGAGFDLIALHFTRGKEVKVFELDQEATMNVKVETLREADIEHDWITYVPVDYSRESWVDKLLAAGFDRTRRTLFVWQSVSLFLEEDAVRKTLREMADLCEAECVVAQDFYSRAFVSGETSTLVRRTRRLIEWMGESWRFGIDMSSDPRAAVESFLNDCGWKMTEFAQFGEKREIEPFYCIVEAEKR
jgi:methyltransferase (TIGR00027 family)